MKYKALVVQEEELNKFTRSIKEKVLEPIRDGFVLIEVHYSALNYKDALSARGHKGITRNYPHTPGIDASGIVVESKSALIREGEKVLVTGYDLGMNTNGGFAEYITIPADWIVPLPNSLSLKEAMILGTAGFTSALCIDEFVKHNITPEMGKILVTGASGGVGCLSISILSKLGYYVIASTGKIGQKDFLLNLGAKEISSRQENRLDTTKPLLPKKWIGAIDNVGGVTLATIIKSTDQHGVICSVGLVESDSLNITVYPFILRGVSLIGIDSAEQKMERRIKIWNKLANEWKPLNLEYLAKEVLLDDINPEIDKMLRGEQIGKVLIKIKD